MRDSVVLISFALRMRSQDFADWAIQAAEPISGWRAPKLQIWTMEPAQRQAGLAAVFSHEEDAARFLESPLMDEILDNPGFRDLEVMCYEAAPGLARMRHKNAPCFVEASIAEVAHMLLPTG